MEKLPYLLYRFAVKLQRKEQNGAGIENRHVEQNRGHRRRLTDAEPKVFSTMPEN